MVVTRAGLTSAAGRGAALAMRAPTSVGKTARWTVVRLQLIRPGHVLCSKLHPPRGAEKYLGPGQGGALRDLALTDRKSTRLNSSHVRISYAVFCLKNKKIASFLRQPSRR